jgi:ectoine hydroxylase-related dioxygenase (phytanoyl-CoA dioxygenase family)
VEAYYGKPVTSVSAELVTSWPTKDPPFASQLWHRDTEGGSKQVRAMCYLTDVTVENGPFCYVPGSQPGGRNDPHLTSRLNDQTFAMLIPETEWVTYTGPRGMVILFDTMGYHRGLPNLSGKREALVFTYHAR